jgi:hypothetical protein
MSVAVPQGETIAIVTMTRRQARHLLANALLCNVIRPADREFGDIGFEGLLCSGNASATHRVLCHLARDSRHDCWACKNHVRSCVQAYLHQASDVDLEDVLSYEKHALGGAAPSSPWTTSEVKMLPSSAVPS